MSAVSISPLECGVPSVVTNTPVEIWQEIINQILFDPILFLHDPFYPGCNYHTALNEWSDTTRLLKLEVQRGILRLVSRSWKRLADLSQWRYFEPYRCNDVNQERLQSSKARRLEYPTLCDERYHAMGVRCDGCSGYMDNPELKKFHLHRGCPGWFRRGVRGSLAS